MNYKVKTIPPFDGELKRLARKYPSLAGDYLNLLNSLEENPIQGTSLGNNCYKIRLAIKSKNKGKSGGGRVITNVLVDHTTVYLLSIYDKSEEETITDKELSALLKAVPAPSANDDAGQKDKPHT